MSIALIQSLRDKREALAIEIEAAVTAQTAGAEIRILSPEDEASLKGKRDQLAILDARIDELQEAEVRAAAARKTAASLIGVDATTGVKVVSEEATYRKGGNASYFADLARVTSMGDPMAAERLRRHAAEMRSDLTRTDGAGGYFVPPAWLIDQYAPFLRAGRVIANLTARKDLPGGTDSINIPRITTGTAVAAQQDLGAVQQTDIVDNFVSAPVITLAGQEAMAIQLLDQSPVAFDEIVMMDLAAALAQQVDVQVINGSGSSGNVKGIIPAVPSGGQIAFTSASPTVALLYPKLANAIQQIQTTRFMPPTGIVMHPRRWAWILAALDGNSRPLVTPYANLQAFGEAASGAPAQGAVGSIMGLPVYTDANIPTNFGAGTNEDRIIVGRFEDALLFEGSLRTRALPQPKAATLEVLIQAYEYLAFTAERFAVAFAYVGGTGLVAPTF